MFRVHRRPVEAALAGQPLADMAVDLPPELYHSRHRSVPRPATWDVRPTCSRPESRRAGGGRFAGARRRTIEATRCGLSEMGAGHDDEHQDHPCHRRRRHRDARPGWDGMNRVRGPCKGRARRRRLAGRNRGRRLDRPARGHPCPASASARGAHRGTRGRRAHRAPHPRARRPGPARTAARRGGAKARIGEVCVSDVQRWTPATLRAFAMCWSFFR